ncbi:MAG TPA: 3' terminal RNA ribose 2'-O-methyltransferase Hen1, partial [Catenuloplanes sp.]
MLLTVTTTHRPATDLGYLLVKHPDRVHSFDVPTGTAYVVYPEATEDRCTAALLLDVDPVRLAGARGARRGRGQATMPDGFTLGQYVNDRPYAASSLLAGALAKVFRSALRGESKDRPALAAAAVPLEVRVPVLRCRGGAEL